MRRRIGKICQAEDGVAAIEFAMLAPILFVLMFGIVEYGMIMLATHALENTTSSASRLGKTGYTAAGQSREAMIHEMIKDTPLIDPSKVVITTLAYKKIDQIGDPEPFTDSNNNGSYSMGEPFTDINGNGQWDVDMAAAGLGSAGDVVVYTVDYPWEVMTPLMGRLIGQDGVFTISSTMVVRNEPYDY